MWAFRNNKLSSFLWFIMSVVTVLLPLTHGQQYHYIVGNHQLNIQPSYLESNNRTYIADTNNSTNNSTADLENSSNTTTTVTTVHEYNGFSKTTMDVMTIIWYVATFLCLAFFFFLMFFSNKRYDDSQPNAGPIPLTPSPSYTEFAPPSYDSAMKMQHATSQSDIFVIPVSDETNSAKDVDVSVSTNTNENNTTATSQPPTPSISVYTINELEKIAS